MDNADIASLILSSLAFSASVFSIWWTVKRDLSRRKIVLSLEYQRLHGTPEFRGTITSRKMFEPERGDELGITITNHGLDPIEILGVAAVRKSNQITALTPYPIKFSSVSQDFPARLQPGQRCLYGIHPSVLHKKNQFKYIYAFDSFERKHKVTRKNFNQAKRAFEKARKRIENGESQEQKIEASMHLNNSLDRTS